MALILEQPTKEQLDFIYGEFDANSQTLKRDAYTLMEWMEKQPHLPKVEDEDLIIHCLLRCKNSIEKAKVVLDAYYTIRAAMPDVYDNRDTFLPEIAQSIKTMSFLPLSKLTSDGCRVSILRVFEPELYNTIVPEDILKVTYMSADLRLKIDHCRSDILIFDLQNFTMPIISLAMANLRKFIILGTKGIPMRHKSVLIINAPSTAESLIMLAKSFIRKDLVKKLFVLKSAEELLEHVSTKILPKDYGGEGPELLETRDAWIETLKSYREWFISENKVKADVSKRLNHTNSRLGNLDSLDGSFRKLTVD